MPRNNRSNSSKVSVPGSNQTVEDMKYEIANEFGVNLGANATAQDNGRVGGEITKRLVDMAKNGK